MASLAVKCSTSAVASQARLRSCPCRQRPFGSPAGYSRKNRRFATTVHAVGEGSRGEDAAAVISPVDNNGPEEDGEGEWLDETEEYEVVGADELRAIEDVARDLELTDADGEVDKDEAAALVRDLRELQADMVYENDLTKDIPIPARTRDYLRAVESEALETAFEEVKYSAKPSAEAVQLLETLAAEDVEDTPEVEPEDVMLPTSFKSKEVRVLGENVDPEQHEQMEAFILSKKIPREELKNLVPKDWATAKIDWFADKRGVDIALPEYKLNFLWLQKNIAVAVDQVYSRGQISPLTEFFFWPRKDAWEDLKAELESKSWIAPRDRIILLNRLTEVINYWQDEEAKHSVEDAREKFPDCTFAGA